MDTLVMGAGPIASGLLAANNSSTKPVRCPCSGASFRPRQRAAIVRCNAQKNKRSQTAGSGFGTKTAPKPSWDAGVLLRRSEQLYSRMVAEHSKEGEVREFVICVRQRDSKHSEVLGDWLPVAELALVSEEDASVALPLVLPVLCREVAECAGKGAVSLRNIPRSCLEYAYEPAEAFYEYVLGVSSVQPLANAECPYAVLGLPKGASTSQVRGAYRSLAAKHHPDRQARAEYETAEQEFKRVTSAYDQIKRNGLAEDGGVATYASLGGTARNGLSEPINMKSINMQSELQKGVKAAVRQLDSDIINRFLARSCARSGAAVTL